MLSGKNAGWIIIIGLHGCGSVPADGCCSHRDGADAQSQFWCQERIRDDPELQGPSRRVQQTQDH